MRTLFAGGAKAGLSEATLRRLDSEGKLGVQRRRILGLPDDWLLLDATARLLVRGDPGLASETHWVASGMWLPDWYPRDYQRPDPHGAGVGVGDYLPGPAPLRAADAGGARVEAQDE